MAAIDYLNDPVPMVIAESKRRNMKRWSNVGLFTDWTQFTKSDSYSAMEKAASEVICALLASDAVLATKYLSKDETVRVKRVCYNGKINKRAKRITVVVSLGRPNYVERKFIKKCQKAREPFPVKKIQLKFPKQRKTNAT